MRRNRIPGLTLLIATVVASTVLISTTQARQTYLTAWLIKYPESTIPARLSVTTGSACNTCHHPPNRSTPGTCYRGDIAALLAGGSSIQEALDLLDTVDSDGDGVSNGEEILMARSDLPGEIGYHPGLIGATGTDPCGTDPAQGVTGQPETPPSATGVRGNGSFGTVPGARLAIGPNPARGSTRIAFELPESRVVELAVFSVSGRRVRTLATGRHREGSVVWNGRDEGGRALPAGVYLVRLQGPAVTPMSEAVVLLR